MKYFLIILMVFSNAALADIYCPQSLTCNKKNCSGFSAEYFREAWRGGVGSGGTFYFYQASSDDGGAPTCFYGSPSSMAVELAPKVGAGLHPNSRAVGNKWVYTTGFMWWCQSGNPQNCPFLSR